MMFANPLKYWWDRIKFQVMVKSIPLKVWWDKVLHKQFHIGWAVGVLIVGMIICIVVLNKLIR